MWIRSAFWVGEVREGSAEAFTQAVNDELVPALKRLPGVRDAAALWPRRREDEPPHIACQILVYFDDREGVETMLASRQRHELRDRVGEIAAMFDGSISHIDYEVTQ